MDNYVEEEVVEETTETPDEPTEEVVVEEVEAEEEAIDWEARAKKAEAAIIKAKSKPKTEATHKTETKLSTFDQLALIKANIETEDDLDEVVRWADYNKITVAQALQSNILKATLNEKAEQRLSALAVNTGTGRRASGAVSEARLLADAQKGIMPESAEDIAKLARMRISKK